jgi:hypothetical protein
MANKKQKKKIMKNKSINTNDNKTYEKDKGGTKWETKVARRISKRCRNRR